MVGERCLSRYPAREASHEEHLREGPGETTSGKRARPCRRRGDRVRRRELLLALAGAFSAARTLGAEQKVMPLIGFLGLSSPGPFAQAVAAFHQGLRETGYVEGQNVAGEYRWAEDHYERLPALAADLVARQV